MTVYRAEDFPQVEIHGKPNERARRLTLRRDSRTGEFTVSHPKRVSQREIQKFLNTHSAWIAKHYEPVPKLGLGSMIPFRGELYEIIEGEKRGVRVENGKLAVKSSNPSASIATYFKAQAQLFAPERIDYYAERVNKPVKALRWRDPKSRWGSCDSQGVIMLSWRLIMAPDEVFDYVIAHEVAHRVEMNHSDRYWAVVDEIYPNHQVARKWLRNEGKAIQALIF